jgi:hypothetical protein
MDKCQEKKVTKQLMNQYIVKCRVLWYIYITVNTYILYWCGVSQTFHTYGTAWRIDTKNRKQIFDHFCMFNIVKYGVL